MPIFCVKSAKFTLAKKNLHGYTRGSRDKYEVCALCTMHYALGTLHATHLDHQQPGASPRAAQQHQVDPNFGNFVAVV